MVGNALFARKTAESGIFKYPLFLTHNHYTPSPADIQEETLLPLTDNKVCHLIYGEKGRFALVIWEKNEKS
jgi:hypothetical protein